MDFSKTVVIDVDRLDWTPSPLPGVERRRLEREAAESGRATSVVRYRAGASFRSHTHPGGEEYLVLEGTFSDEHGDFGVGSYVRNPPGSSHAPFTREGCTIFVKLCQMRDFDRDAVEIDTCTAGWQDTRQDGYQIMPLYQSPGESVALERLDAGTRLEPQPHAGGQEILVLDGMLELADAQYGPRSWIRSPPGRAIRIGSSNGCTFWVKRGHLASAT